MGNKAAGLKACWAILALCIPFAAPNAQPAENFYKGRPLVIVIGFTPGGGYDLFGRTVGRHIAKHIPGNPNVVPQNMPGAGSLKSINYLYSAAPKDGSTIAIFSRGVPFEPLFGNASAPFDPSKFNWIGSPSQETNVVFSWHTTPFKTFEDVLKREMLVASTGTGADTAMFPLLLNEVLKTKFKIVTGYPGAAETFLAVERSEVDGIGGISWGPIKASKADWLRDNRINILLQLSLEKHPDLPNVPLAMELVTDSGDKQLLELFLARLVMAWPFAAPPDVPAERVKTLRRAFAETMTDPGFLADAKKQDLEISPVTGETIESILKRVYSSPKSVVERGRELTDSRQKN